jgi:uncharacterized protein
MMAEMATERSDGEWIAEMVRRLVHGFDPLSIVLFGSRARGAERHDSDVDLLVVLPEMSDRRVEVGEMLRALADVPVPKDVVVTTPEEIERRGDLIGTVLRPALREGKVLYERG